MTYWPSPYKPRLFPRVIGWTLTVIACVLAVLFFVGAMWFLAAIAS